MLAGYRGAGFRAAVAEPDMPSLTAGACRNLAAAWAAALYLLCVVFAPVAACILAAPASAAPSSAVPAMTEHCLSQWPALAATDAAGSGPEGSAAPVRRGAGTAPHGDPDPGKPMSSCGFSCCLSCCGIALAVLTGGSGVAAWLPSLASRALALTADPLTGRAPEPSDRPPIA